MHRETTTQKLCCPAGGQAKRTNIGLALVTSPRVLFLDEPTSGLDSFTANEVTALMKNRMSSAERQCGRSWPGALQTCVGTGKCSRGRPRTCPLNRCMMAAGAP